MQSAIRPRNANPLIAETTIPSLCCINRIEVRSADLAILKRLGVSDAVSYRNRILERLPARAAEFDHERFAEALARCPIDRSELAPKLKVLLTLRHRAILLYRIIPFRQGLGNSGMERDDTAICEVKKKPLVLLYKRLNEGKD